MSCAQPLNVVQKQNGLRFTALRGIAVNDLYLTSQGIYVSTTLLGAQTAAESAPVPTNPCIVIKTELLEERVIFE